MKLQKQWNDRLKLWAEGSKLRAEGSKLRAEGDKLWADAILEVYGNIKLEWKFRDIDFDCELENGEIYRWDDVQKDETA